MLTITTIEASYKNRQIFHVESYNVLLFCEVKIEMPVTYNEWILVMKVFQSCFNMMELKILGLFREI